MTIDKHTQVFNIDIASYTTEDVEEEVDWELARQDQDSLPDSKSASSDKGSTSDSSSKGEIALAQIRVQVDKILLENRAELASFLKQEVTSITYQEFDQALIGFARQRNILYLQRQIDR